MKKIVIAVTVMGLLGMGAAYAANRSSSPASVGCPGLIDCPLTGGAVCADRCPLVAR